MGKRKEAKELAQRLGSERRAAHHDARRLAVQIADGGPYPPVDVYSCGLLTIVCCQVAAPMVSAASLSARQACLPRSHCWSSLAPTARIAYAV
jgi:hypothetical protein